MSFTKQRFDYEKKRWGTAPIKNLVTDFQGLELKFFLANAVPLLPKKTKLLDLGCGGGNMLGFLKKRFPRWQITGLDISAGALAIGKKRFPKIEFIQAPAQKIPKEKESFEIVTAFDALEHFENLDKVLAEVKRVLKPNGLFYIAVPLEKQFPTFYWLLYKFGWRGKREFAGHINFFDDRELEKLLAQYGFELVQKRFSNHLIFSLFDVAYYLSQSLLGKQATSFESSVSEFQVGLKRSFFSLIKKSISALAFFESSLFFWFPGGKGHFIFVKKEKKDFFSVHPPLTILEDGQRRFGLKKMLRPKDLATGKHFDRLGFGRMKSILDFGCGNGIWLERLLVDHPAAGVGVDISEGLIAKANSRPNKRGRYFWTANKWPLKPKSFDFCYSFDVFEHLENKKQALLRLYQVMKPGAKFLFYTLNPNNQYTFDWLFERLGSDYLYRRADHQKSLYLRPEKFSSLLRKAGFKKIEYTLYDGPANLFWDVFCYAYLAVLEKLASWLRLERLLVSAVNFNDLLVRLVFPLNNLIDRLFFTHGYSNGYFIFGEK